MNNKIREILDEFDAKYSTDGCGKALVIIEDNENSSPSQRPAQDEIRTFLKEKLVEYARSLCLLQSLQPDTLRDHERRLINVHMHYISSRIDQDLQSLNK